MAGLKRKARPSEGFDGLTDTDLRWFLGGGLNRQNGDQLFVKT